MNGFWFVNDKRTIYKLNEFNLFKFNGGGIGTLTNTHKTCNEVAKQTD